MGSLPREHTGVGSATNGALLQIGGALGVAVIGSLLATRYQGHITATLAPYHLPSAALATITGSVGGALGIAAHVAGPSAPHSRTWPAPRSSAAWTSACSPAPLSPPPAACSHWPCCPPARPAPASRPHHPPRHPARNQE
ncbi:MAG: hypothetical protein ABSF03_33180, partial [Streptosporangiaceae bacterium]